jgi:hypothetical protein
MGSDALGIGTAVAGVAGAGAAAHGATKQANTERQAIEQAGRGIAFDPTNPLLRPLIGQQVDFLQGAYNGSNPYAQFTSPLQQQATAQMSQFLNQPSPESRTLESTGGALQGIVNGQQGPGEIGLQQFQGGPNAFTQPMQTQGFNVGANPFGSAVPQGVQAQGAGGFQNPLATQFAQGGQMPGGFTQPNLQMQGVQAGNQNNFAGRVQASSTPFAQELQTGTFNPGANPFVMQQQNPFAGMGFTNPGEQVVEAAQPIFEQNLRKSQAQLANAAPGRFSSAFAAQGADLNNQAINDFNLFAGQQLAQGQQLQAQQQQQALQFMLGSRGQAQEAFGQQQGLGLEAFTQGQGQRLQSRELAQGAFESAAGRDLSAQQTNASTRLGELGLDQQGLDSFNQASLQARQLFQQGQLDLRGLEQQLSTQLQSLGIDAARANNEASLQAQSLAQEAQSGAADRNMQGQLANQQAQLQARQLEQQLFTQLQQMGLDANTAAQQARLQAQQIAASAFQAQQGLGLDAMTQFQNQQLAQRGQSIGAFNSMQQNQIGAAGQMGQLAQMAGMNDFQRMLQGGQFGLNAFSTMVNPLQQLQLAGLQYAAPSDLNVVMGANSISGLPGGPVQSQPSTGGVNLPGQIQANNPYGLHPYMLGPRF